MKNFKNIILKAVILTGIILSSGSLIKSFDVQYLPINQQQYPGNQKTFPCGCIGIAKACELQFKTSLQDSIKRVQAVITPKRITDGLEQSNVLDPISREVGLNNLYIVGIINQQIGVAEARGNIEQIMSDYKFNQQNQQIHFLCMFPHPQGEHGFLINMTKENITPTIHVFTDQHATQAYAKPFVDLLNNLYETVTPEMAHPQTPEIVLVNGFSDEDMVTATAASLETNHTPSRDDKLTAAIAASLIPEKDQQQKQEEQEIQKAIKNSLATQQPTLQERQPPSEEQWNRLIEVNPGLIGLFLEAKIQQGCSDFSIFIDDITSCGFLNHFQIFYILKGIK